MLTAEEGVAANELSTSIWLAIDHSVARHSIDQLAYIRPFTRLKTFIKGKVRSTDGMTGINGRRPRWGGGYNPK